VKQLWSAPTFLKGEECKVWFLCKVNSNSLLIYIGGTGGTTKTCIKIVQKFRIILKNSPSVFVMEMACLDYGQLLN